MLRYSAQPALSLAVPPPLPAAPAAAAPLPQQALRPWHRADLVTAAPLALATLASGAMALRAGVGKARRAAGGSRSGRCCGGRWLLPQARRAGRAGIRCVHGHGTARAAAPSSSEASGKVVLLGDSVLDNFFWLETPERHLRVQLQEKLQGMQCVNLAVDQMTTFDFEERKPSVNPWEPYARAREKVAWADEQDKSYTVESDGVIRSPKALAKLEGVRWCVLSIGGNDVYLNRSIQAALISSLLPGGQAKRQEVADEFGVRLRKIVASVRESAPDANVALVIPYRPHREFSLLYGAPIDAEGKKVTGDVVGDYVRSVERECLPDLVTPMVREILRVAKQEGCPVIDLSRTLDPNRAAHYGTGIIGSVNALGAPWSGAEPSDVSVGFIADLIAHTVGKKPAAKVYRGLPSRKGEDGWQLLIKEEVNDVILIEDYFFGEAPGSRPGGGSASSDAPPDENASGFGLGVFLVVAFNVFQLLRGGEVLFFDKAEWEQELKALDNPVPVDAPLGIPGLVGVLPEAPPVPTPPKVTQGDV